ncbi:LOW QUALITY PROTEIN: hypothetical protein ACHAW5_000210 [Stephanodiscus triporus]|uniref:Uncharacterized protein n=1 Tax=Stephanodiscus triporus TaxID=2934178 RepID=A0ABD3MFQ5_9STRA
MARRYLQRRNARAGLLQRAGAFSVAAPPRREAEDRLIDGWTKKWLDRVRPQMEANGNHGGGTISFSAIVKVFLFRGFIDHFDRTVSACLLMFLRNLDRRLRFDRTNWASTGLRG